MKNKIYTEFIEKLIQLTKERKIFWDILNVDDYFAKNIFKENASDYISTDSFYLKFGNVYVAILGGINTKYQLVLEVISLPISNNGNGIYLTEKDYSEDLIRLLNVIKNVQYDTNSIVDLLMNL